MSKLPDLQSAVRRIDGVASATVRWPDPHGPATLRVEFSADADRAAVTELVIATLRQVAGVDVDDIRLDMHPGSAGAAAAQRSATLPPRETDDHIAVEPDEVTPVANAAQPDAQHGSAAQERRGTAPPPTESASTVHSEVAFPADGVTTTNGRARPVFSGMTVDGGDLDTRVQVTLAVGASAYTGIAEGLATRRSAPKTAAIATLSALHELLPSGLRVQLEWLDVIEPTEAGRPAVVQAAVTCLTRAGEDVYIGTAIVRTDLREAAVRATLDALNRQLFRWRDLEQVAVPA